MKRTLKGVLAAGILAMPSLKADEEEKQVVGGDPAKIANIVSTLASNGGWIDVTARKNYTGSFGFAFGDAKMVQTDVGINLPGGKGSVDIWSNYNTKDRKVNEHDFSLNYPLPLAKMTGIEDLTANSTVVYLIFPTTTIKDAANVGLNIGHKSLPISFSAWKVWSPGSGQGQGYSFDLAYNKSIPLNAKTDLHLGTSVIGNAGYFTRDTGLAVAVRRIELSRKLAPNTTLKVEGLHQRAIDNGRFKGTFKNRSNSSIGVNYKFK